MQTVIWLGERVMATEITHWSHAMGFGDPLCCCPAIRVTLASGKVLAAEHAEAHWLTDGAGLAVYEVLRAESYPTLLIAPPSTPLSSIRIDRDPWLAH